MSLICRPHTLADADQLGEILADGWADAYAGFMPAEVLARRTDHATRRDEMRDFLTNDFDPNVEGLIVAAEADALAGFVHLRLGDKRGLGAVAAVNLLYVRRGRQGQGIGRRLVLAAAEWIGARTAGPIVISAYAQNPFRAFYDHIGGTIAKRVTSEVDGHRLESVLYLWPDAESLAAGAAQA